MTDPIKCVCGSDKIYTCTHKDSHGHHCVNCNRKVNIDWNIHHVIEEKETD